MNKDLNKISQSYRISEGSEMPSASDRAYLLNFFDKIGFKQSSDVSVYFRIIDKGLENPLSITIEYGLYQTRGITIRIWMSSKVISEKKLKPYGKINVEDVVNDLRPHLRIMFEHAEDEIDRLTKDFKETIKKAIANI